MFARRFTALAAVAGLAGVTGASAVLPVMPRETGQFVFPFDQITPMPTSAPYLHPELMRRQDTGEETTVLVAPDNVCGYISGRPGASLNCPADFNCILFPAQSTLSGEVACCNPGACNLRLTCLDFDQISSSSLCDDGCKVDPFTLKCTDSMLRYCNTASFPGSVFDYWCNDAEISTPQPADTTFSGQTNRDAFAPLVIGGSTTAGDAGLDFTINTSNAESATGAPSVDDSDSDGDSDNNTDDKADGDGGGGGGKKSNTGAIVGGVVGGLGAIGLLGAGAFLLMRRKNGKGKKTTDNDVNNNNNNNATTFPPNSPMSQTAYGAGGMTPQNQSMYGAPAGFQQQKLEHGGYYNNQQPGMMQPPVDRGDSTSPMTDPHRLSHQQPLGSPTPSQMSNVTAQSYQPGQPYPPPQQQQFQQTQPTIHEAGGAQVDHHRGQMHELA